MPNLAYTARKFNARELDPNPQIRFISVLKKMPDDDKALAIMKAVAAQMKRIMERMKLVVNSFEEYPHNKVLMSLPRTPFSSVNWNHGEVIELVLRRANGSFLPLYYLLNVMCHELAHIQQMNHGPNFRKLDNEIKRAVKDEREKGYYGDGFYSSGIHLATGIAIESDVLLAGDAPEYLCGGAANKQAPGIKARTGRGGGRKRRAGNGIATSTSGAQTAKRRKPGGSNTRAFEGREDAIRIDGNQETSYDEIKRLKELLKERKAAFRASHGLTMKAATEKAMNSLTPAERRLIETSTHGKSANTANARDARAAHFERLLAAKADSKPASLDEGLKLERMKDEDTDTAANESNDSDGSDNEEDLDEYAKDFLAEMNEDERKVAKGDDMLFFAEAASPSSSARSKTPKSHTSNQISGRAQDAGQRDVIVIDD
ncbi:hypothetical protein NliqN6_6430 [Naganishia liquefaciens]|uniref:WLM domain-containing protein n=1 Tax=Naganishia liquefaciens TaxID=104408 RepID=A0A8H3TZN3_9TREE|nr:hypothetical protein NliqN6_6430 [Naganishia liquefaciens]